MYVRNYKHYFSHLHKYVAKNIGKKTYKALIASQTKTFYPCHPKFPRKSNKVKYYMVFVFDTCTNVQINRMI